MKTYWKCLIAAFLVLFVVAAMAFIPDAYAVRGVGQGFGGGGMGVRDIGHGGMGHGGIGGPGPSQSHPGHGGDHGGGGHGSIGPGGGHRTFDRNTFFGGHDHDWWRHNTKHHYWNGNAWIYGIEPIGFIVVPVPISSCPYTPGTYGGDANACFFSCTDGGYDPISVCDVCCGTSY